MSTDNPSTAPTQDPSVIVSAARQLLEQMPPSNASAATKDGYKRELKRLITRNETRTPDQLWAAICSTRSKRTYYRRIAATKHFLRNMIEESLEQEKVAMLEFSLGLHSKLLEHVGVCPIENSKPRHSKRQDLRGLPWDWRESLYAVLRARKNQFQRAYLVAAVSGCRPAELVAGVTVEITDTLLTVRILHGAKVKEYQGQPWREISYRFDSKAHPLVQALHEDISRDASIHAGYGAVEVKINKTDGLTSAIRRAGKFLWPKRKITPYCLRHAAASDWKACLSADEVSGALGHFAPDTKRLYGQAQMSKTGGLKPVAVKADRPVKATSKTLPGSRPKPRR